MRLTRWCNLVVAVAGVAYTYGHGVRVLEEAGVEEDPSLFEGDIIPVYEDILHHYGQAVVDDLVAEGKLKTPEQEGRRLGLWGDRIWKERNANGEAVIPVTFANSYPKDEQYKVWDALGHLESSVKSIKFVKWTSEDAFIRVQSKGNGCSSFIGKVGGAQAINLGPGCRNLGTITHEFMHALAVYHEQSRPDRERYVDVHYENVRADFIHNFNMQSKINSLGSPYDFNSVMHYSPYAFSKKEVSCQDGTDRVCKAVKLQFLGVGQDSRSESYCIGGSGTTTPCGNQENKQVLWLLERYDATRVRFRLLADPSRCLDPGMKSKRTVSVQACRDDLRQTFQIHGLISNQMKLRWEGDNRLCLQRRNPPRKGPTASSISGLEFTVDSCETASSLLLLVESKVKAPCVRPPVCSFTGKRLEVISSKNGQLIKGNSPSEQDLFQLQLLYQCPSGPRKREELCSVDCPCFEGQYSCRKSEDCRGSLVCSRDRICVQPGGEEVGVETMQCDVVPSRSQLVKDSVTLGSDFHLRFNLRLDAVESRSWANVLFLGDSLEDQALSVFFPRDSAALTVQVQSQNKKRSRCASGEPLEIGREYEVHIVVEGTDLTMFLDAQEACKMKLDGAAVGAPTGKPLYSSVAGIRPAAACLARIEFVSQCENLVQGHSVGDVDLGANYVVSAQVKLNSLNQVSWTSLFHIGSEQTPSFLSAFIYPGTSTITFRVPSVGDSNNACTSSQPLTIGTTHAIRLEVDGSFAQGYIDDVKVCSSELIGGASKEITNQQLFLSHPKFPAADACVSNVIPIPFVDSKASPSQVCSQARNRRMCPREVCSWGRVPGVRSRKRSCYHSSLKRRNSECNRRLVQFEAATSFCEQQGLTLCTLDMLQNGLAGEDTCLRDRTFVWVSDASSCTRQGHALSYNVKRKSSRCVKSKARRAIRCC